MSKHGFKIIFSLAHLIYSIVLELAKSLFPKPCKDIRKDVILITGGGRGIGRKIALLLARKRPSCIVLWGRHINTLEETANEVQSLGVNCVYMVCDVSQKENIYAAAEDVKKQVGHVTMLVNNAGVVYSDSVISCNEDNIVQMLNVNTMAHFWTLKAFLPAMMENNYGHVVSINSVLGFLGLCGAAGYVTSKFSSTGLTEALTDELRTLNKSSIHVTSVHPYHVDNSMFKGMTSRLTRWFIPPLNEDFVAKETVTAILTNKQRLILPRIMYFLIWITRVSPVPVNTAISKLCGTDKAMEGVKTQAQSKSE